MPPFMNTTNRDLYAQTVPILRANPTMGKKKLAHQLGIKTPTARRLIERYRGETQGHGTHPDYLRVQQLKGQHPEWGAVRIAQQLGLTLDHAKLHLARWLGAQAYAGSNPSPTAPAPSDSGTAPPPPESPQAGSTLQDSMGQGTRDLCYRGTQIKTLEELLIYAEVDTSVWEVEKWVANKWEVGARNPATGEILTAPLFQIKAWLRRKVIETTIKDLMQSVLEAFKAEAPTRIPVQYPPRGDGMLEIAIVDLHYGKLCWGEECGRDYNTDIAERMFWAAIEDLLAKAQGLRPAKILFPVGNDFYHTDILGRTTTAGTPQDSSMVWKQAFTQGWKLLAKAIERLRQIAPVEVPIVNGNHDTMSALHMGEVLAAYFRNTSDVSIDHGPAQRKYVTHHKCLLGLSHGSEEKHSNLPLLMASERPQDWAHSAAVAREWHVGHLHHKKSLKFLPCADLGAGVVVRIIPSLTPQDSWHASKGYASKLAAEAYYWDPECGVTATLTHHPV